MIKIVVFEYIICHNKAVRQKYRKDVYIVPANYYFMMFLQYFAALATPIAAVVFVVFYIIHSNKKMRKLESIEKSIAKIANALEGKTDSSHVNMNNDIEVPKSDEAEEIQE